MDLSIVIVNYKSKGDTLNCIKSIKDSDFVFNGRKLKYEIIVVDNNSGDAINEIIAWQHPEIIFIQSGRNAGMGAGNNVGMRRASGDYIVVANPDTICFKDSLLCLYRYMEKNQNVGMVGPRQFNPDGSIQLSCYRWHGLFTPIYRRTPLGNFRFAKKDVERHLMADFDHKSERKVDWLLGSFLFIRAKALKEVGYFDERYFMYFEDTDLCRSFWRKKWEVLYYPEARIIHNHARESAQGAWYKFFMNPKTRWHIASWLKYILKWRGI